MTRTISAYSLIPKSCHKCILLVLSFSLAFLIINRPPDWRLYTVNVPNVNLERINEQRTFVPSTTTTTTRISELPINSTSPCTCTNSNGEIFDFCYRFPQNESVIGKKFSCSLLPFAKKIGILEKDYIKLENNQFPSPVFITGSSQSHWNEQKRMILTAQKYFPGQRIVFYDLGLHSDIANQAKSLCQVEYRKFDFQSYPAHVRSLNEYRWKPIIIAETLKEFGSIWWMDSSAVWKKSDLSHVYELIRCRMNNGTKYKLPTSPSEIERVGIESGWHKNKWRKSIIKCDKFAYLLHGWTGHGIFPATNPHVYTYFPADLNGLKQSKAKMFEAGFLFAVNTKEVIEHVVKWYVLCALEKDCMAPPGSSLGCNFGSEKYSKYARCHRFDQSVVNLLLANANQYDRYYYTSEIVDFFNIVRGGGGDKQPKICNNSNTNF